MFFIYKLSWKPITDVRIMSRKMIWCLTEDEGNSVQGALSHGSIDSVRLAFAVVLELIDSATHAFFFCWIWLLI